MTALEIAMDKARCASLQERAQLFPLDAHAQILAADTSEGMCCIYEDTPLSKPVAIVTVAFARKFCAEDPYYTWRKL